MIIWLPIVVKIANRENSLLVDVINAGITRNGVIRPCLLARRLTLLSEGHARASQPEMRVEINSPRRAPARGGALLPYLLISLFARSSFPSQAGHPQCILSIYT